MVKGARRVTSSKHKLVEARATTKQINQEAKRLMGEDPELSKEDAIEKAKQRLNV